MVKMSILPQWSIDLMQSLSKTPGNFCRNRKILPKIYIGFQGTIWKQNKAGGLTLPDIKTYYKAIAIKIVCYWYKDKHMNQWRGFPGGSAVKNSPEMQKLQEIWFDSWVWEIPWRRKQQPTPVFLSRKSHGQRSLGSYSPWGSQRAGHNSSDLAHTHACVHTPMEQNRVQK